MFRRAMAFFVFMPLAAFILFTEAGAAVKGDNGANAWHEEKSEHFIVAYQHVPLSFVKEVVDAAESHYRDTMTTMGFTRYKGWTWSQRVRINIYDSQESYVKSAQYAWSGGQVNPKTKEISTFPTENGFFDSTLPHELGHIIFHEAVGFNDNIPLWLDEGVAMYQERAQSVGADDRVRRLITAGKFIALPDLDSMALRSVSSPEVVRTFYVEAASLVGFLINKYEIYRFERLCRDLKDGQPFTWALKKAYMQFEDMAALEKAWRRHLNEARR